MKYLDQTLLAEVYEDLVEFSWLSIFLMICLSGFGTSVMINSFISFFSGDLFHVAFKFFIGKLAHH